MTALIEPFISLTEINARHETVVAAPADLVFQVAREMDLRSIPLVSAIFRLRERILGGTPAPADRPKGLVAETLALGWGRLAEKPGRELVMGAVTKPWMADVVFTAVAPDRFAAFAEPGFVKIVWTLEAEPIDATHSRFRTQTRALPTDDAARRGFRRYWHRVGVGIVLIRRLTLRAVRREAERRFRGPRTARSGSSILRFSTSLASHEEQRRPMPADSIVPEPMATVTNAITIDAPPEQVWPWLAQMGGGRAGWCSYDRVDNGGHPSARHIVSELQDVARGDILPAIPGATDAFVVAAVQPARDLVLTVPGSGGHRRVIPRPLMLPIAGIGHRIMLARHLRGIKQRAEADQTATVARGEAHGVSRLTRTGP